MINKIISDIKYYFLILVTPIQKLFQHIGKAETVINKTKVDQILSLALPGDILLSHERQRLTSLFIKGFWDHASIVSSKITVIEAVGSGVREVELEEWLYKKDFVCLIRPLYSDENANKYAGSNALGYIGAKYDFTFSSKNPAVYCSELIYLSYVIEDRMFLNKIKSKRDEILPQDYFDLCNDVDFKLIYNSKG